MHGPPATQPAQQNGSPTWNSAQPTISPSQETQVNGRSWSDACRSSVDGSHGGVSPVATVWTPTCTRSETQDERRMNTRLADRVFTFCSCPSTSSFPRDPDGWRHTFHERRCLETIDASPDHASTRSAGANALASALDPVRRGGRPPRARARRPRGAARAPARVHRQLPGEARRRLGRGLPGLPRPAQRGPRSGQGRPALPPGDRPRRRPRAGDVDDLEVRPGRRPVRRREGRRHLRPERR